MTEDTLTPFLNRLKANLETNCREAMQISVDQMRDHAMVDHKYRDRSGLLTKSMFSRVEVDAAGVHGVVGNSSEVALYQHEGTGLYGPNHRAYEIRPKNGKALAFEIPGTGERIVVKKVIHPGVKPDPFLSRAIHQKKAFFFKTMKSAVTKAIKQSAGQTKKSGGKSKK